jgi:hypothetical protein
VNHMGTGETEQILSIEMSCEEQEVQISLSEFDYYCTLFEDMLEEMEGNEYATNEAKKVTGFSRGFEKEEMDLDDCLDEFDLAEIEQMKERYGLSCVNGHGFMRGLRLLH